MPPPQQNRPTPPRTSESLEITNELAQSFLANRQAEIGLEAKRVDLQNKQLDYNADYANQVLKYQAESLKTRPAENRKTLLYFAGITAFFTVLLMGFVIYCLYVGERDFIYKILQGLGYFVTTALGYWLGQRGKKPNKDESSSTPDAEVVDSD